MTKTTPNYRFEFDMHSFPHPCLKYRLNPMRRQFEDRKISRRTEGPEGDFVGPQTLFAWDLHSQWMQTLQNTFTIILWE